MKIKTIKAKARNFFKVVLKDPLRKNLFLIFYEYSKFIFTNKIVADQYFKKYMYRKGMNNFYDYLITEKLLYKCWRLNSPVYTSILDDKYLFELFFLHNNIRVVKSYAYNINSLFFIHNEFIQINSVDDFTDFLSLLLKESSINNSIIIKKKEDSLGGSNIFKIFLDDLDSNTAKIENLYNNVINSSYLFQDVVVQHKQINELNPYCINTIRIDTYTNKQKISKIISSIIRIGVNKSIVDNISKGGVFIGINSSTGKLLSDAYSDFTHGGAKLYKVHPDTMCKFEDFQIPFFEEAKKLAIDAAQHLNNLKVIGWDIVITPDGPLLLEGNYTPGINFSELALKGFRNNPVFLDLYEEINNKNS